MSDHTKLLEILIRDKFGVDSSLTLRQQQNRLKADIFNEAQQNSLEFIHRSVVIPLGETESISMLTVIPPDVLEKSLRLYIDWDTDKCQRLSEELLSNYVSSSQDDSKHDCDAIQYQGNAGNENLKEAVMVDDEKDIQLTSTVDQMHLESKI